ncbi:hypothetical protein BJ742DRAFT_865900, partial [Cladochytrium replicatum]
MMYWVVDIRAPESMSPSSYRRLDKPSDHRTTSKPEIQTAKATSITALKPKATVADGITGLSSNSSATNFGNPSYTIVAKVITHPDGSSTKQLQVKLEVGKRTCNPDHWSDTYDENALKSLKANRDVSTPGSSRHPATTSGSSSPKQASKRIALPTPETGPSAPRRAIQFREYDKSPSSSIALRRRDALDGHDDMRGVDRFLKAATGATGSVQGRALKQQSINTLKDATRCDEDEVDEDNIWQSQKKVRLDLKGKGMATAFSGREQGEYSNSVGIDVGYGNGERNGNVKRKSRHQALDERSGYDSPSQHVRALQAYYSKRAEHVLSIIDS